MMGLASVRPGAAGIAISGDRQRLEVAKRFGVKLYLERTEVLLEVAGPLGARNRDDVIASRQHPRQRHLSWGCTNPAGDGGDLLHTAQICG